MSNSKLVDYTRISPNKNPRKNDVYNPSGKVTKITIHHVAGVASVESLGSGFAKESRQASSNYGIGSDCRVGLYVPEDHRAWTSGSRENDYQAVTIEVSNSAKGGNWPVSDEVLSKLIDLCVDICERNGIEKLNFTGNKSGNLTMHKWFEATSCPGPYLESKFPYIAEEVNKRLAKDEKQEEKKVFYRVQVGYYSVRENAEKMLAKLEAAGFAGIIKEEVTETKVETKPAVPETKPAVKGIEVGSTVRVKQGAKDYKGGVLASFVYNRNHTVKSISGDRVVITYNGVVVAAVHKDNLILV